MKCNDCGRGEVILFGGEAICLDCTLFWPTADDSDGDEPAAAEAGAACCDNDG